MKLGHVLLMRNIWFDEKKEDVFEVQLQPKKFFPLHENTFAFILGTCLFRYFL